MRHILVVEDEAVIRTELGRLLRRRDFEVTEAPNVAAARTHGLGNFNLVLTDLRLPDGSGAELLEYVSGVPVIVMTAFGTISSAVEAIRNGAVDYLSKPIEPDELVVAIERALREADLERENTLLREQVARTWNVDGIIGRCPEMQRVLERISKVAPTDATTLILGESGTGKELVARAIHARSSRSGGTFVPVNCASIPEGLIESELFGHERGAFTGAVQARSGLVQSAHKGTLFLDEVGELTPSAQARLLRVIQEGEVRPVGSNRTRRVNVRVVTATHRDLPLMVDSGTFRRDLYYRLKVVEIAIPPLRVRGDDIIELAETHLEEAAARLGRGRLQFSAEAREAMRTYTWPGNVRELINAVERAVILYEGGSITVELLGLPTDRRLEPGADDGGESLEDYFRTFVLDHQDHLSETEIAGRLGISRKSLWERRKRAGIPRPRTQAKG